MYLILQPEKAVGTPEALYELREQIPLQIYGFTESKRYLHAKVVIFETETASYVLSGSPNCTRAALLLPPEHSNVEVALLRRDEDLRQFDYLLKPQTTLNPLQDLTTLKLQAGRLTFEPATPSAVQVLDATLANETLNVCYRIGDLPEDITTLQLRITTVTPIYQPLKELAPGKHRVRFRLTQVQSGLQTRPWAVSIGGQDANRIWIELGCNELWLTNADELHAQMMNTAIVNIGSGGYLAEGIVANDAEWGELYKTLTELIELDLTELKSQGGTYTTTAVGKPPFSKPEEGETKVYMIGIEELAKKQADTQEMVVEQALFDESRFNAWLEYVSGRLSGVSGETPEPGEEDEGAENTRTTGYSRSLRVRRRPTPRVGRCFVNLVHKYIRSLHNVAYMQSISILQTLTYFIVFQRIVWLLLKHEVIDRDEFTRLVLEMNAGFFGTWNEWAPLCTPRLHRHIRRVWQAEWRKYEVAQYALVSMELALRWIEQSKTAGETKLQAERQLVRVYASIALVINTASLTKDAGAWAQIAKVYQDEEELTTLIRKRITHHHSNTLEPIRKFVLTQTCA